jgi:integrase
VPDTDTATVSVLEQHSDRQAAERGAAGPAWEEHGLVFTQETGKLLRPDAVTALFTRLVKRTGLPRIRLHGLRHTHASLALSAGVDVKVVSSRLGHSTTAITPDLYTHVVPELARQAADAIAGVVPVNEPLEKRVVTPLLPRQGPGAVGRGPPNDKPAGQEQSRC